LINLITAVARRPAASTEEQAGPRPILDGCGHEEYALSMPTHAAWHSHSFWRPVARELKPLAGFVVLAALALLDFRGTVCIAVALLATGWYLLVSD
jgi:hypothetical protein